MVFNNGLSMQWAIWEGSITVTAGTDETLWINLPISFTFENRHKIIRIIQSYNIWITISIVGDSTESSVKLGLKCIKNSGSSNATKINLLTIGY